ncbi:MAG: hypothetical protein ACE15C_02005 [Phycisphaerae bacterium]
MGARTGLVVCMIAAVAAAQDASKVGVVSHIKVLSDKSEDISSPEDWKKTYIKEGMSEQDKAIAIWKTVTKYRHQDAPPGEGLQDVNPDKNPNGNVHDPFKTFHVYGYGMCCCAAADIEGLARYIGMPARGRIINLHSVPEVWYNDSWHLLDSSLTFFLQKPGPDGKPATGDIASVDEMKKDIADWLKDHPEVKGATAGETSKKLHKFALNEGWLKGPPLFATANLSLSGSLYHFYSKDGFCRAEASAGDPNTGHGWASNLQEYNYKIVQGKDGKPIKIIYPPDTKESFNVTDYGAIMGYQLNVQLREGEKLTRCWYAKAVTTGLNQRNAKRFEKFLKGDMTSLSLQQDLGDKNPGRIGNGVLEYDAMADSKLCSDALTFDNLTADGGKLRVTDGAKPGVLVVRMPSSYVYLDGKMAVNPALGEGGSAVASISFNNGLDWKELAKFDKSGEQTVDLKDGVFNKYDYRVKLEFKGGGSGLDALKFTHAVQHSQAPLPVILEGDNKITFSAGAPEGTVTVECNMNDDKAGGKAMTIADFHPTVEGVGVKRFALQGGHGSAIMPIATPGEITRLRVGVHWRARDPKDGYDILASFDNGETWKSIGKLEQANPARSAYIVSTDVPAGKRAVQFKFAGSQKNTTCIFDLRLDVDYKEPAGGFRPVKVTYVWDEGGTEKKDEHVASKADDTWTIKCGPKTVAKSYTVELAK